MMAMKKILEQEPSEIEMLLPLHAAGTLNARDAKRVEEALARDPELAKQYAVIREEYAETIGLNESLGAPSARAMQKLFAAIDGEPARKPSMSGCISAGVSRIFRQPVAAHAGLVGQSRRTGAVAAGRRDRRGAGQEPAARDVPDRLAEHQRAHHPLDGAGSAARAGQFAPDARVADITALLDSYQASIVDARGGMFRLQFGTRAMSKDELAGLMNRLKSEKIVSLAVAAP